MVYFFCRTPSKKKLKKIKIKKQKLPGTDGFESTQPAEVPPDGLDIQKGGLESLILSMLHHWSLQGKEPSVVIDLVQKNFSQDQMYTAHCSLKPGENITFHRVSGKRPAAHAQAESLYNLVMSLNHSDKLPRFTVSSEDLTRVSAMVNCLELRDERSVAARMESLELSMRRMQDTVMSLHRAPAREGRGGQEAAPRRQVQEVQVVTTPTPEIVINEPEAATFANVAAKAAAVPKRKQPQGRGARQEAGQEPVLTPQGQVQVRGRSPSLKRGNEWLTVDRQNVKKVKKTVRKTEAGTSAVDFSELGAGAQAGPIQFYIGNTFSTCTKETVKHVLKKCAENVDNSVKFDVLDVHLLTTEENPRSKCWKVVVPHHCREIMERPNMYPPGWRHRRFYGGSSGGRNEKRQKVSETIAVEEMEQRGTQSVH